MASSTFAKQGPMAMKEPGSSCKSYTPPARYAEVVNNPKRFRELLEELHATMGTKFMIPIIGGRELDLHRLFVEVTSRGGIEKIIKERRWKEVTAVFNFPSTATNASFVLRKYYVSLLHRFEQIYYFGSQEPRQSPLITAMPSQGSVQPPTDVRAAVIQELRNNTPALPGAKSAPLSSSEQPVTGIIDGKFNGGYLVTVTIGSEKLQGVLYEAPPPQDPGHQVPTPSHNVVNNNTGNARVTTGVQRRRRRKKSEIKRRDPAHPKPNRSGYNFFFAEQHARLKPLHPGKDREISRMIGELWNKLKESERAVYQEEALKDKERYRIEMEGYRERLKTGQVISDAVPLQQRLPVPDEEMVDADTKLDETGGDTPENDSCSGESVSEYDNKTAEKDFDMEASPEAVGGLGAETTTCMGLATQNPTFETSKGQENKGENNRGEKISGDDMVVDHAVVEKADGESVGNQHLMPTAEN